MSKVFLVSFAAIAATAAIGVDYLNQSRRAGVAFGQMSAAAYSATISGRIGAQPSEATPSGQRSALIAQNPRMLLPDAPAGWTRRNWTDTDQLRLASVANEAGDRARIDAAQVWVYEKPEALVAIRLIVAEQQGGLGALARNAMTSVSAGIKGLTADQGFALVQGVTYVRAGGADGDTGQAAPFRTFEARIGTDMTIEVRAAAPDDAIIALLNMIDYDHLNAARGAPVAGIGSDSVGAFGDAGITLPAGIIQNGESVGLLPALFDSDAALIFRIAGMLIGAQAKMDAVAVVAPTAEAVAAIAAPAAPVDAPAIKVNRPASGTGFGTCTGTGAFKHCKPAN